MKKACLYSGVVVILLAITWIATTPPTYYEPVGPRHFGSIPRAFLQAKIGDITSTDLVSLVPEVPGHDEVLALPGQDKVLVSARDEWIWLVDLEDRTASKLVYSPVSPTGAQIVPGHPDQVYFCMARLDYHTYDHPPGLYRLDLTALTFTPVVLRVPVTGTMRPDGLESPNFDDPDAEKVYPDPLNESALESLDESNSRPLQFCNDLAVSPDARHIYISEPFSNPNASSGLGAMPEGITLARNGRIWRYDASSGKVGLVLENVVFADGLLIEYDDELQATGLLVTETVNARIGRAHFRGAKAGTYEVLWDNLPGLPDGLDRDADGRVWVALIKDRTPLMNWIHAHPWVKPFALRIPARWLPPSPGTAFMALSPDASKILAYSHHDGSRVLDISVVVPIGDKLFLSSFHADNKGLHFLPVKRVLDASTHQNAEASR